MIGSRGVLPLLLLATCVGGIAKADAGRRWTLEDIVTIPRVTDLRLASDGKSLAYLEHRADIRSDKQISILHIVDLATGQSKEIVRAEGAEQLQAMADNQGWSILLDRGSGLQLFRIDRAGKLRLLLSREAEVLVGQTEGGLYMVRSGAPRRIGILYHSWSPDGRWLWYATLTPKVGRASVARDTEVVEQRNRRRAPVEATVEFRLRSTDGVEWLVASRPSSDRLALYYGGNVQWAEDGAHFQIESRNSDKTGKIEALAWSFATATVRPLAQEAEFPSIGLVRGPKGGAMSSEGFGDRVELVETDADGRRTSYGYQAFVIGDPRSAGNWRAANGKAALLGTRTMSRPRYGLAFLTARGTRQIAGHGSFTACDFRKDLAWGICVEESLNRSPHLVWIAPHTGETRTISALSSRHDAITPLRITSHNWQNRLGYSATGFIIWPRRYRSGHQYPAILVTHGSDADERFGAPDLQWNYPVQLFAERGYVVILMNDPSARQRAELWNAHMEWASGRGALGPAEVRRLIWLNGTYSFVDAISELAREGIVDPERIGIAGYSRGAQMVNVTVSHSTMFRAASSGDGAYLEPASYVDAKEGYHAVFGGPPSGPFLRAYRELSPSLRASETCAAVLQQMATPFAGAIDFYTALRAANVPAQISLYPGEMPAADETHLFHIPSNRLQAMRENLAWFDFWLSDGKGVESGDSEAIGRWTVMAANSMERCAHHRAPVGKP